MTHDLTAISTCSMRQYTKQSLVLGIDLILFCCNRNLHMEQHSKVNSSHKVSECKCTKDLNIFQFTGNIVISTSFFSVTYFCVSMKESSGFFLFLFYYLCKLLVSSLMFHNFIPQTFLLCQMYKKFFRFYRATEVNKFQTCCSS